MTSPVVHVIDDDPSVRNGLHRLLRSMEFEVAVYADAEQFLAASIGGPGCLIVDYQLPGMNALELQQALAESGVATPIVFISANPDAGIRESALAAGALAFLVKPFDEQDLRDVLASALG